MTDEQKALREAVARAMWESVGGVAEKYQDAVWNGTYEDCGVVLRDEDFDGFSWQGRVLGRNTFRGLADAAIAVALERAAEVADNYEGKGMNLDTHTQTGDAFRTRSDIAAAIRALIKEK